MKKFKIGKSNSSILCNSNRQVACTAKIAYIPYIDPRLQINARNKTLLRLGKGSFEWRQTGR